MKAGESFVLIRLILQWLVPNNCLCQKQEISAERTLYGTITAIAGFDVKSCI